MKVLVTALGLATALSLSISATAYDSGAWVVRVGATEVSPDDSSDVVSLNNDGGAFFGASSGVGVDSNTQLGLNIQYMLNEKWGLELLAATPFQHEITGTGSISGVPIGETKHLPPTFSLVYYFNSASFKPYIGAGLNYTIFFDEEVSSTLAGAYNATDLELDDSFGIALQVGFDFDLGNRWFFNGSLRWINIETDAAIALAGGGEVTTSVDINPYVYTLSLGYDF